MKLLAAILLLIISLITTIIICILNYHRDEIWSIIKGEEDE